MMNEIIDGMIMNVNTSLLSLNLDNGEKVSWIKKATSENTTGIHSGDASNTKLLTEIGDAFLDFMFGLTFRLRGRGTRSQRAKRTIWTAC